MADSESPEKPVLHSCKINRKSVPPPPAPQTLTPCVPSLLLLSLRPPPLPADYQTVSVYYYVLPLYI